VIKNEGKYFHEWLKMKTFHLKFTKKKDSARTFWHPCMNEIEWSFLLPNFCPSWLLCEADPVIILLNILRI
jgi:hypothetical protein